MNRSPDRPIVIRRAGLVTAVGLTAAESCAAFRAKLTNPTETKFFGRGGEPIMVHEVPLERPWRGIEKLSKMAAMAIAEALQGVPRSDWDQLPVILCVAEPERPGRTAGLDDRLFELIRAQLGAAFASTSAVIAQGRVSVAVALARARTMLEQAPAAQVVIAAADSLLTWPTLDHYDRSDRLLTERNTDGFMPGEAAGALLIGSSTGKAGELACTGIGFGRETARVDAGEPLRGDGLTQAVKAALTEAALQIQDMDFRITDNSGEQYYFKEAELALSRTLRVRKEEFDIWHPAECTGETGAASGIAIVATAHAACAKRYGKGPNILAHMANDGGQRAALALQYRIPA